MDPIRTERHMRIACIGAGASGLCFAYKLQRSFEDFSLTLFERNDSVGGVWVANRYPGFVVCFLSCHLVFIFLFCGTFLTRIVCPEYGNHLLRPWFWQMRMRLRCPQLHFFVGPKGGLDKRIRQC